MVDCVNPFDQRRGGYSAAPFTGSASQLWPHLLRTSSVADLRPTNVHHLCKAPVLDFASLDFDRLQTGCFN